MEIIYRLDDRQIEQLHKLYRHEWWTKARSLEDTKACVSGSQICVGLVENDVLIGFARVITDYTFKAFIFDVIVREDQRGKGLGNKLVSLIKSHKELKHVKHFELYCRPDMMEFYQQYSFEIPDGIQLMRYSANQ